MINFENQPVAIYGAGQLGLKVYNLLRSKSIQCEYLIDKYKKTPVDGVTSITLDEVKTLPDVSSISVLLCTMSAAVPNLEIIEELKTYNFKSITHAGVLANIYPLEFKHFFLTSQKMLDLHKADLKKVRDLFTDDLSVNTFDELIELRYSSDFSGLSAPDTANNYFPPDLQNLLYPRFEDVVFCDLGAYNGDTFDELSRRSNGKLKYYVGFEPERGLYEQLKNKTQASSIASDIYQAGTWEFDTKFFFGENAESSTITGQHGDYEINCFGLDNFKFSERPTVYKMDIEGAELPTLKGMKGIIKRDKPVLEVCLYHKPEDIWEIPLFISSLRPDYRFFLRTHEYNGLQTVLYCI